MDDEIIRAIEKNKIDGKEIDLMELIGGNEYPKNSSKGVDYGVLFDEVQDNKASDNDCIYADHQFSVLVSNGKIKINDHAKNTIEIETGRELTGADVFKDTSLFVVIFFNGGAEIYEFDMNDLKIKAKSQLSNVQSVKRFNGEFFLTRKHGYFYQIIRLHKNHMKGDPSELPVVDMIMTKIVPKFFMFKEQFYFSKNGTLFNANGEDTRILGEDFEVMGENLLVIDTKNKRKIVYLVGKDLQLINEIVFPFDEKCKLRTTKNFGVVAFKDAIHILRIDKGKIKSVNLKAFERPICDFYITEKVKNELKVAVLTSKNKKEDASKKPEVDKNDDVGIFKKIVEVLEENKRESEIREKKRFEALIEKICEQLNKNLTLIIGETLKNELNPIAEKFEKIITRALEKKIQSKVDSSFKSQEVATNSAIKKMFLSNVVPIVEAGINEMKLQLMADWKSKVDFVEPPKQSKPVECKTTKLFNLIQRNEIQKGIELVLDSNEAIFDALVESFKPELLNFVEPSTVFELFRKTVLFNNCADNGKYFNLILMIVKFAAENTKVLYEFASKMNEDLILKISSENILILYAAALAEAFRNKNFVPFCEDLLRNVNVQTLDKQQIGILSKLMNETENVAPDAHVLKSFVKIQRSYLKRMGE